MAAVRELHVRPRLRAKPQPALVQTPRQKARPHLQLQVMKTPPGLTSASASALSLRYLLVAARRDALGGGCMIGDERREMRGI